MATSHAYDFTRVFDILSYQREKYPQHEALLSFRDGQWVGLPIETIQKKADNVSAWLHHMSMSKGDRIAIVPKMGSPEWMILDFGCQQVGVIVVPIHPTSSPSEVEYILNETGARICVCADGDLYAKVNTSKTAARQLEHVFHLQDGLAGFLPPLSETFSTNVDLDQLKRSVTPDDILAIMYTSGTSGTPKGAVLTHGNVVSNIKSVLTLLPLQPGHRVLSFLPFSHIFERTSCLSYMAFGVSVHFSHSLERLREDFNSVQPFFCTCVPRTLEKMYDYLQEQKEEKHFFKRKLINWAMNTGARYKTGRNGFVYAVNLFFARLLVLNAWRGALGGEIKYMAVGAAALRPEIGMLFSAAGIKAFSGYGMTEASPFISTNRYLPGLNKPGTVGIPVPGVELRIDEPNEAGEGEILVKGPNIMQGYFKRPDLNQQVFTADGWFRTGDVGKMVARRFLAITDRKKDIFKTSAGKYIAPQPLQSHFAGSPFISQCLVIGFNKPFVTAILVPHFQLLKTWCEEQGIHWTSPQFMVHNIKVIRKYQDEVDRLNEELQGFERVKGFVLSDEEWTVENKELTTSFKPVRGKLLDKYQGQIEKLYT